MRVLMLGWEFPPFISGGLGTACYGLTRAMSDRGTLVTFVLPKSVDSDYSSHVKLLSPQQPTAATGSRGPGDVASGFAYDADPPIESAGDRPAFENVTFKAVPSRISSPYPEGASTVAATGYRKPEGIGFLRPKPAPASEKLPTSSAPAEGGSSPVPHQHTTPSPEEVPSTPAPNQPVYQGDLVAEARRYADLCVDLAKGQDFDVIHAHDWLTFPAAQAISQATGKPWVAHVHSTEFDRSGEHINTQVAELERLGVNQATRVIAVSQLTRDILVSRYGMSRDKCKIVYNGIEKTTNNGSERSEPIKPPAGIKKDEKVVLFLGRVTMQKGPEYFIAAAKKVLEKLDKVKFVVAGSGDQIEQVIEQAARAGIGHKVTFTGFLHREDVERIYKMADVYVMPSVSEPFGIAPLEAISHDVPVIISKTSGVSEVLEHVLKVDFWDTHDIANKIIAVLRHPPLGATLRQHADFETRELTWNGAAEKCESVYKSLLPA
jgi:glycosyltransferase involved in cell wall biosynthesis